MNALPADLIRRTSELSEAVTQPIPGSRKIHVEGPNGMRVPMREIALSDTPKLFGAEQNAPFVVYDTSGIRANRSARASRNSSRRNSCATRSPAAARSSRTTSTTRKASR
jgi:hypothetical protein